MYHWLIDNLIAQSSTVWINNSTGSLLIIVTQDKALTGFY